MLFAQMAVLNELLVKVGYLGITNDNYIVMKHFYLLFVVLICVLLLLYPVSDN